MENVTTRNEGQSEQFSFKQLPAFLKNALQAQGITEPTPIQKMMIPEVLSGQHVVARSQTGTGKTLAYLLPILATIDDKNKNVQAVIVTPTQELAMQVLQVARELVKEKPLPMAPLIGGANIKRQLERLKKEKPQFVVGTPGRLLELLNMKKLKLHETKMVVVDEADRIIAEKSSWEATMHIIEQLGKKAQFMFVSATIPEHFSNMIGDALPFLVELEAGPLIDTKNVTHLFLRVEERDRIDIARKVIHAENIKKGIIFTNTLEKANETAEKLTYKKIAALPLTSDQSKLDREKAIRQFRDGKINILVATDVAARGMDVEDVSHIIQLEPPSSSDSYVHRAGRTGRMGKKGTVITLIATKDEYKLKRFHRDLGIQLNECTLSKGRLVKIQSV